MNFLTCPSCNSKTMSLINKIFTTRLDNRACSSCASFHNINTWPLFIGTTTIMAIYHFFIKKNYSIGSDGSFILFIISLLVFKLFSPLKKLEAI